MTLNFREYRQSENAECGLICIAIASGLLGAELSLPELRQRHQISSRGLTLKQMVDIAGTLNLQARALKCDLADLKLLNCPAILHWGMNHYVVLERVERRGYRIIDTSRGPRWVDEDEVNRRFTGIALELAPAPGFEKRKEKSPLTLRALIRFAPTMRRSLSQVLLLSILLQAYMIGSPLFTQLAIDQAAARGDHDFLVSLAMGFGIFAIFNAIATGLRGLALQRLSAELSWDMTRRVFHHMMRLPLPWFQRRRLADAMTRFDAITPIRDLIANGFVSIVIDGVLSVAMVAMMFIFSVKLAIITLIAVSLAVGFQIITIPFSIRLGMSALTASIVEQSKRIETLRGMQTIKVMAAEGEREGVWANRFADVVRTQQDAALLGTAVMTVQKLVETLSMVIVVYVAISAVLRAEMTVGVFYAFLMYRSQFSQSVLGLVTQFVNWRMMDIYSYRLADIVLHPREPGIDKPAVGGPDIKGAIGLSNVTFSYASHERPVLRNVSLRVEPGEFVAIAGPSGAGKTTLLKVLMGLYPPTYGEVRIDGAPLSAWSPSRFRRSLGVVMQDDELLSGSIAENVAFFDEQIDMERVWEALKCAAIDEEIAAMPMRTDTIIGDMGSSLSGGQKQRILLARAFYRNPRILLLDEATSHVDLARERLINEAVKQLNVTRIVIAHRPDTLAAADRILTIVNGAIVSDQRRPPTPKDSLGSSVATHAAE